jgi:pilus assembly protein CpaB
MSQRSVLALGAALLSGLLAMLGVNHLLANRARPPEMCDVLLAAAELKEEVVLKPEMLQVVKRPREAVPEGGFASPDDVVGRWVSIRMLPGEPIVGAKLAPKDAPPGLIGRIPRGLRAFTLEVTEKTGVSGFILPTHHVDVIQDLRDEKTGKPKPRGRTILQNVEVLAAGQTLTSHDDKSIVVRTVTLSVTPTQAEVLTAAQARGPLSLSLRGIDDLSVVDLPAIDEPEPRPTQAAAQPPLAPPPVSGPPPERAVVAKSPPPPVKRVVIIHGLRPPQLLSFRAERSAADPGAESRQGPIAQTRVEN